jgi:uracil-DNA glycosylase
MAAQAQRSDAEDAAQVDATDNGLREPLARVFERAPAAWRSVTDPFIHSDAGRALAAFVDARVGDGAVVYPRAVLHALEFVPPEAVRVVILGQDPYHGAGQAQGLAFSIAPGHKPLPPSLRNLLKEVRSDTGVASQCVDDLSPWARQGVLLLNAVLTVEQGAPQSHAGRGWEALTDALLARVAAASPGVVFMLWGAAAQRKRGLVECGPHRVLTANHPSPLSANRPPQPFVGSRPFTRANALLAEMGVAPVRW